MLKKIIGTKFWSVLISCLLFISISNVVSAAQPSSVKNIKSGKIINSVQAELNYLGYYHGRINGVLDKTTREAIKVFQKKNLLKTDGIPGRKTRKAIRKACSRMKKNKTKSKEIKKLKSKNLKKK